MTQKTLTKHVDALVDLDLALEEHRDECEECSVPHHWAQDAIGQVRELIEHLTR